MTMVDELEAAGGGAGGGSLLEQAKPGYKLSEQHQQVGMLMMEIFLSNWKWEQVHLTKSQMLV